MYSYGIKNTYRPTKLAPNAFGWSTRPQYNRADVPTALMQRPDNLTSDQFLQQFAYEWFQSGDNAAQGFGGSGYSNPPFVSGASGRLHPALRDQETGLPARILRGYIRRADFEAGDPVSKSRLYFMFNPETIQRDYVSYLNQPALDPFNTVYESGNLVAPPSILDFSFTLLFDRQEEAQQPNHPGVFVDYQYFDLVVRNVIPADPNQSSNTLPDNGVMMVNPRNITVVFSPQLTVEGRPLNASVSFERFTHRMTPTRMVITLQMRAIYLGPVKDMVEYKKEELQAEAAIPYGDQVPDYGLSFFKNEEQTGSWFGDLARGQVDSTVQHISDMFGTAGDANHQARLTALYWARTHTIQGGPGDGGWTDYNNSTNGNVRYNLPNSADCSGLVTEAYVKTGNGQAMGWQGHPGSDTIISLAKKHPEKQMFVPLSSINVSKDLLAGDILIGSGHVAFFNGYDPNGTGRKFDASGPGASPEVGERNMLPFGKLTHLLRPMPVGSTSAMSTSSVNKAVNNGSLKMPGGGGAGGAW